MRINIILVIIVFFTISFSCAKKSGDAGKNDISNNSSLTDTLKVVTLYGPTSYFLYRGEEMGMEYENVKKFADDEKMILKIQTVNNMTELIQSLKNKEAHLAAYPVPYITEYNQEILHCGPKEISWQVLVQKNRENKVKDVTELIGKEVYVEKDSKFQFRLENLNEELGGGIIIKPLQNDTLSTEDFLDMVNIGKIEYAVIDSDIALLNKEDYPELDITVQLSLEQAASWAVAKDEETLAAKVDAWEKKRQDDPFIKAIYKRYYERGKYDNNDTSLSYFEEKKNMGLKTITPYDDLFKQYEKKSGYDWELLAAIGYCESRYQPDAKSRYGASGLMQVMPASARSNGVDPASLANPDDNLLAATRILAKIEQSLEKKITDPKERIRFMLASYNAGLGHVYDAIALAEKMGLNPEKWTGNVSVAALMKSRPEFYNDPVVKNGYFRGRETVDFVENVMNIYNYLLTI